jgi:hypothetical protein
VGKLTIMLSICLSFLVPGCFAQKEKCPAGATFVGNLEGAGAFNSNLNSRPNVLLPVGFVLNESYHQSTLQSFGGGSDARSTMQASEVPAGLFIAPYGTEDHDKGWAVHTPELAPAVWKGNLISQFKFSLTLYCTTGSGEIDRTTGGCNVKVPVCAIPAAKTGVHKKTDTQPAANKND